MAHPYSGHKQNTVGHRRVKYITRQSGGEVPEVSNIRGNLTVPVRPNMDFYARGELQPSRMPPVVRPVERSGPVDIRAGVTKRFQSGGPVPRHPTPSKEDWKTTLGKERIRKDRADTASQMKEAEDISASVPRKKEED